MFASQFPVRLLIRCGTCQGHAIVNRDDYARRQVFCAVDGVPMTVVGVSTGAPGDDDWPGVKRVPTSPVGRCACVEIDDEELALA